MARLAVWLAVLLGLAAPVPGRAEDAAVLWAALRSGGHVALLRHALAPGFDDPPGFRLGDCATQRLLSEEGREQARALGARFRAQGIRGMRVHSSQWCRCWETAELLDLGPVEPLPALNSFFRDRGEEERRTRAVLDFIGAHARGPSLLLVTHQVNILALTGVPAGAGEVVVARYEAGGLRVLGRLP